MLPVELTSRLSVGYGLVRCFYNVSGFIAGFSFATSAANISLLHTAIVSGVQGDGSCECRLYSRS